MQQHAQASLEAARAVGDEQRVATAVEQVAEAKRLEGDGVAESGTDDGSSGLRTRLMKRSLLHPHNRAVSTVPSRRLAVSARRGAAAVRRPAVRGGAWPHHLDPLACARLDLDHLPLDRRADRRGGGPRLRRVLAVPGGHRRRRDLQHDAPHAAGHEEGLARPVRRGGGAGPQRPPPVHPPLRDPDLHGAVPRARADGAGDRGLQLSVQPEDDRDHHPRDRPAGLGERRPAQREVRRPARRLLSHQGSARAWDRGREVRRDELGRPLDGARADRAGRRPEQGADHGPRLGLSRPSPVLRVDQLSPCARAAAGLCDLAAGAPLSQQHLGGADGRARDVGDHVAVADVPSLAAAPPGRLQQLHVQPRVRPPGRLLGQGRDSGGLAVLLEVLLRLWGALSRQVRLPADLRRLAQLPRLRIHPHEPVQPDQAVGLGRHRRAVRA